MKNLYLWSFLALMTTTAPACDKKEDATPTKDVVLGVEMRGFPTTGTSTQIQVGVAKTEADARAQRGTVMSGTVSYAETRTPNNAAMQKRFTLSGRTGGEHLWLFASSSAALQLNEYATLYFDLSSKTYTLGSSTANGLLVVEVIVSE